jgi:hypothetical protein
MTYNLFLDDMRNPSDVSWIDYEGRDPRTFVVVRNYVDFGHYIAEHGVPDFVSFDHDLADIHYIGRYAVEPTGKECAVLLKRICKRLGVPFPAYKIHSMNPVGVERIRQAIDEKLADIL